MLVNQTSKYLKEKLSERGFFEIYQGEGITSNVTCKFNDPVPLSKIEEFEEYTNLVLPDDYKQFLLLHNGISLFDDVKYGGEFKVFDLDLVLENYQVSVGDFPLGWITIAYHFGEEIVLDCEKYKNGNKYCLMYRGASEPSGVAYNLNLSFELWLDRLVICQGLNFWNPPKFSVEDSY